MFYKRCCQLAKPPGSLSYQKLWSWPGALIFLIYFYWKNFFFFYLFCLLVIVYANNRFKVHRIATLMLANSKHQNKKNERKRQGSERLSFKRLSKLMANARSRVPRPTGGGMDPDPISNRTGTWTPPVNCEEFIFYWRLKPIFKTLKLQYITITCIPIALWIGWRQVTGSGALIIYWRVRIRLFTVTGSSGYYYRQLGAIFYNSTPTRKLFKTD